MLFTVFWMGRGVGLGHTRLYPTPFGLSLGKYVSLARFLFSLYAAMMVNISELLFIVVIYFVLKCAAVMISELLLLYYILC